MASASSPASSAFLSELSEEGRQIKAFEVAMECIPLSKKKEERESIRQKHAILRRRRICACPYRLRESDKNRWTHLLLWLPVLNANNFPSFTLTTARWNSGLWSSFILEDNVTLIFGFEKPFSLEEWPESFLKQGRTKTWKQTKAEAGFPGRAKMNFEETAVFEEEAGAGEGLSTVAKVVGWE